MNKELFKHILLGSVVLALVASCSDDGSDDWGNEIVSGPAMLNLDSIERTDSLYSWYLDQVSRNPDALSSNAGSCAAGKSSSSGGAAGKDTINALMELLGKANK